MAEFEYVSDIGAWSFGSLIESAKLDRMTRNLEANHQNKVRGNTQYESSYGGTGDVWANSPGEYKDLNLFEAEYCALLVGVRVLSPVELTGRITGADLLYPTGLGLPPFLRRPVITCSITSYYVPSGSGADQWQAMNIGSAVDWYANDEWLLVNLGQPQAALENFTRGAAFVVRTAGFMDPTQPTGSQGVDPGPLPPGYVYIHWHATGAVGAYL